jgi:transcription initiation factor TFIIIB Brf1 subunit/transcription initiation factor TFIIB
VYRAREAVENEEWLEAIEAAGRELELDADAVSTAEDLFLSSVPEAERSKRATAAASLYAASLVTGAERSQQSVAEAMGVSRLSVQGHWKELVEAAGFDAPSW